jgi:NADH-quinone oxidoreductase subunit N
VTTAGSIQWTLPASVLLCVGALMLGAGAFLTPCAKTADRYRRFFGGGLLAALILAAILSGSGSLSPPDQPTGLFVRDAISISSEKLAILGGLFLTLVAWNAGPIRLLAEKTGCLAILLSGLMFVGCSADLTTLFLSLELVSIPTYVLLGIAGETKSHREATLKYFALSAFSSALFLFGASYLYGITGTTSLDASILALRTSESPLASIAWTMIVGGLAFRITAFPFHFYAPDVFAGTSTSMAAALSYLPKVAGFVAILRLLGPGSATMPTDHFLITSLLLGGMLTMTLGNVLAIVQANLRRVLAYSSVAHTGYILVGLAAVLHAGSSPEPIFFYLASYAAMTLGVFAGIESLESIRPAVVEREDLAGSARVSTVTTAAMTICLLSLAGLPLTAGFWAKLQIIVISMSPADGLFRAASVLVTINAIIGAGYYLPLLVQLYAPSLPLRSHRRASPPATIASALAAMLTVLWFFIPMN